MFEKNKAILRYDEIVNQVKEKYNVEEGENIKQTRRIYYSEKSDKVLCTPAIIALQRFVENRLVCGDQKMNYTMKSKMFGTIENVSEKEAKIAAKKDSGFKLSGFEVEAFKDLAERFKK